MHGGVVANIVFIPCVFSCASSHNTEKIFPCQIYFRGMMKKE